VQVVPGVFGKPGPDIRVLVGGVVVQDQVHLDPGWNLRVDDLEELQELAVSVLGQAGSDHCSGEHLECREQRGGAVPLVVMGHRRRAALDHGSDGWLRSSAWTEDFSSMHNTIAFSGGFRYNPTTSISFSSKRG